MRMHHLAIVLGPCLVASADAQVCASYSAARGSLPSNQGWTYQAEGSGAAILEVSGGVLHQSTLPAASAVCGEPVVEDQAAFWFVAGTPFDFADGIVFDIELRVNASEYTEAPCLGWPIAGFMLTIIDNAGQTFAVGFGDDRVWLTNDLRGAFGTPGVVEADLDTTIFREYRLAIDDTSATLFVDGGELLALSEAGDPFPTAANFIWLGDGTTWANSDFETRRFRVFTPGCCRADIDLDGLLTIFDFLAFQNLFDAGDPAADFDGDGSLTIFDFLAFQNAFDAGCP